MLVAIVRQPRHGGHGTACPPPIRCLLSPQQQQGQPSLPCRCGLMFVSTTGSQLFSKYLNVKRCLSETHDSDLVFGSQLKSFARPHPACSPENSPTKSIANRWPAVKDFGAFFSLVWIAAMQSRFFQCSTGGCFLLSRCWR
eukprot:6482631-Amphidinium_carterae.1